MQSVALMEDLITVIKLTVRMTILPLQSREVGSKFPLPAQVGFGKINVNHLYIYSTKQYKLLEILRSTSLPPQIFWAEP